MLNICLTINYSFPHQDVLNERLGLVKDPDDLRHPHPSRTQIYCRSNATFMLKFAHEEIAVGMSPLIINNLLCKCLVVDDFPIWPSREPIITK